MPTEKSSPTPWQHDPRRTYGRDHLASHTIGARRLVALGRPALPRRRQPSWSRSPGAARGAAGRAPKTAPPQTTTRRRSQVPSLTGPGFPHGQQSRRVPGMQPPLPRPPRRRVLEEYVSRSTGSGYAVMSQVRVGEEYPDQSRAFLVRPQGAAALDFRSCLLVTPLLPMRSCLTFFQTHSIGFPWCVDRWTDGRVHAGYRQGGPASAGGVGRVVAGRGLGGGGASWWARTWGSSLMAALRKVPEKDLWVSLPEAGRNDVLRLLGMLLERRAACGRAAAEGTGGEHGAGV